MKSTRIIKKLRITGSPSSIEVRSRELSNKHKMIVKSKTFPGIIIKRSRSKTEASPYPLRPNFDTIPEPLKRLSIWAVWKGTPRENGKLNKPPIDPRTGQMAKVNDPKTFSSFAEAQKAYETGKYDGIGILVSRSKKILCADIDNCIPDKHLSQRAKTIVDRLNTYTEKSPSGKGIHCIGFSKDPVNLIGCRRDEIELYTNSRFLTVTGHILNDNKMKDCQDAFESIHAEFIVKKTDKENRIDAQIRLSPLFLGNISEYDSKSEADLALCRLIYRQGITEPQRIDMIFRESELYNDKWNRPDYRDNTIEKAIQLEQQSRNAIKAEIALLDTEKMFTTPPPEIPWIIRDFIPEGQIGEMIGDGKIGKSSLLLQMAMAITSGIAKNPFIIDSPKRVLVINVEDPSEQIHMKVYHQSRKFERLDKELIKANLHIADGLGKIGPLMELDINKAPIQSDYGKKLEDLIFKLKPKLVILDTKSRLYGLDENNNDHATQFLFQLERIARRVHCSFLIAHHTGKGQGKTTGRGASAFDNNTRFRIVLSPMDKNTASKYGVDEEQLNDFFLMIAQTNYSKQSKIHCFKREEGGVPVLVNFAEKRWYNAGETLYNLLKEYPLTRQDLLRNMSESAKAIRGALSEGHKITAKECGVLPDNLERARRISYEKKPNGKGKIIVH